MSIGERLRELREKRGWTQDYVARKMGFSSNQVVSNYERNYRKPDPETLTKFADLFDTKTDYLLGRRTNENIIRENADFAYETKSERELLLEELEQYGNLAFEGGGEDLSDEELREIVQAMRDAAKTAARNTFNVINKFKK